MDCNVNVINKDINSRFADTNVIVRRFQSRIERSRDDNYQLDDKSVDTDDFVDGPQFEVLCDGKC